MRGISGAGKSTYIKDNFPTAIVCSADHFFINKDGYNFDQSFLGKAHQSCFKKFLSSIQQDEALVVVDNTNVTSWQISPYYLAAETYGYEVQIIELQIEP